MHILVNGPDTYTSFILLSYFFFIKYFSCYNLTMNEEKLKNYRKKRKFKETPEPIGGKKEPPGNEPLRKKPPGNEPPVNESPGNEPPVKEPIFVIQKHDATNLHYDLRLEIEGILASWAVPKGPPSELRSKRLAVRTENHPFEYAGFEGVIPEGEYGAGTVIIWDKGTYTNLREKKKEDNSDMEKSLKEGKIEIFLKGKKIKGGYYLIRTGRQNDREQWLLFKAADKKINPNQ